MDHSRGGGRPGSLAVTSLLLAGAMVWPAYPGSRALIGLAERLPILAEVASLVVVAVALAARPAGRRAGGPAGRSILTSSAVELLASPLGSAAPR